jgi:hypothetical protein
MNRVAKGFIAAAALTLGVGDMSLTFDQGASRFFSLASEAQARVGRPLTPLSYAGVARRTTRRVLRRGAAIATLPAGCPLGTYYGYRLYYCGGNYYQKSGNTYINVYF